MFVKQYYRAVSACSTACVVFYGALIIFSSSMNGKNGLFVFLLYSRGTLNYVVLFYTYYYLLSLSHAQML